MSVIELDQHQRLAMLDGWQRFTPPEWLEAVVTPERVHTALVQHVAEFASGELTLLDCKAKRLRLRDESGSWTGTYLLTVEGSQPGQHQVVPIHATLIPPGMAEPDLTAEKDAFGTAQWHCYLPELRLALRAQAPDTGLTALPYLTDPDEARALLEVSIRTAAPAYSDLRIQACVPTVMRYKPGSRCTILYRLEYPAELAASHSWPEVVVAKVYDGDKGQNAYHAMRALWHSPLAAGPSRAVAIAEPLAYLPEMNVLIQGPIRQERTLKELIRTALASGTPEAMQELYDYVRKTAAGLAELHGCGVSYGETITWEAELAEIQQRRARLAVPLPQFAGAASSLLDRLAMLAAEYPADPPMPAHRSFRPAQVLLYKGQIGFIDFDGFCQAEPAMDLALFMTTLKHIGLSKSNKSEGEEESQAMDEETRLARLAQVEAICHSFLSEYEKFVPVSRQRIALWEALDLLTLVLGSWTKLKIARLDNCMFLLERQLRVSGLEIM